MTQVKKISVTDSNASITFSPKVNTVKIINHGTNPCYFNLNAAATTSHFKLDPSDEISIGLVDTETVQAICDSTKTTTLNIIGSETW